MAAQDEVEFVKAEDGEALQALFSKFCDADGLMTKTTVKAVPAIAELLNDGDLLSDELDDIWDAAPKFPDVNEDQKERVDVDSFIQIYRDIDDIFEEEDGNDTEADPIDSDSTEVLMNDEAGNGGIDDARAENTSEDEEERDEKELEIAFRSICDEAGLVSKEALRQWDEVRDLLDEGMLGEDEFETIWERTLKSPGSADLLDVDGFLSFNVDLDDLFVFEDEEMMQAADEDSNQTQWDAKKEPKMKKNIVVGDDLPPGVIFAELADDDFLLGFDDLKRWGELQEMLDEGDLSPIELQNIYDEVVKAPGTTDRLNEDGFVALYDAIESLFEEEDDDEGNARAGDKKSFRSDLLALISRINSDEEKLPCGLECTEQEQQQVLDLVSAMEAGSSNAAKEKGGNIIPSDVAGNWELLFSSSSAMKFNKGLSGLGGSFPNGSFGGLVQKLQSSKYMSDIEYVERINVKPGSNSFDVRVTGDWKLGSSVNLFSGEPTTIMSVEPDRVTYGPTSTRADHWKSLGPLNKLDITYLDDDLRIMRGTTSTDTIFIFKRC